MAQPRKSVEDDVGGAAFEPVAGGSVVNAAEAAEAYRQSPARRLQLELEQALAGAPPEPRWSARRSLAFMVVSSCALWGGAIWLIRTL